MSLVAPVSAQEIARLLAPVDADVPVGLFDVEDETYQAIDQEMVKLGGLQEATIDWAYIEEASRLYLTQRCKHLRIVGHLSVAWLRDGSWERWVFTLKLLGGMLDRYWETAHPKPGPKGLLGKRKLVALILTRLVDALPRLDRFSYTPGHGDDGQKALLALQQSMAQAHIESDAVVELEQLLLRQVESAGEIEAPAPAKASRTRHEPAPLAEVFAPPHASLSLGNERETRRAVLSMAEFVNQQDAYDPTGYLLRRFGLWAHLQAAPAARQDRRTELMMVPLEIVSVYEDAVAASAADLALLLKVEKSVTASPYWIRGGFLAATIASGLAMAEVAEAIRSATARLVNRLPALQQLRFSDGTVFVDDQCMAWLKGASGRPEQAATQGFGSLREELVCQLAAGGVEPVLLKLQSLQASHRSPRERCHATAIAADLLAERGVAWLAQDLCASVALAMQHTTADAWEPEVFQRLWQLGAPSVFIDQSKDKEPT